MSLTELADRVGVTIANLSILKTGKARAIRFSTLDALCRELDCQPGDLVDFEPGPPDETGGRRRWKSEPIRPPSATAAFCSSISSPMPLRARANRASNSARVKPRFSPVAWISTMSPAPVSTKLASASALLSSS